MREIKFRAWHKKPCYDNKESIDFKKCGMTYWSLGSGLDNSWFFKNSLAIMQYTGLKDKNGKEIYEGDIITAHHEPTDRVGEMRYKVEFMEGTFVVDFSSTKDKYYIYLNESLRGDNMEIIGNKWENTTIT